MTPKNKNTPKRKHRPILTFTEGQIAKLVWFFLAQLCEARGDDRGTRKRISAMLLAINKERTRNLKELNRAEVEYERLAAIDTLASMYKRHKKPENVPDDDLKFFLDKWLGIEPHDSSMDHAVVVLQRNKTAFLNNAKIVDQKMADKTIAKNDRIEKFGFSEMAAINIEDALRFFPTSHLSKIHVKRSNLHKLRKSDPYLKLHPYTKIEGGEFEYEDNGREICKYVMHKALNFPEHAVEEAIDVLWRSKYDEAGFPR